MKTKFVIFVFAILFVQAASATPINISCTDSIKSLNKTATMDFSVMCPVNCTQGSVWGSDLYTTDSAICVSAVHSGIIKEEGGLVRIHWHRAKNPMQDLFVMV